MDGSPLIYNRRDPYLPDLLMCRQELAEVLLTGIRSVVEAAAANPLESKACSRGRHQASRRCRDGVPQLRLYDTADRQVRPVSAGEDATMYVCGITPYDATHLGHAATYLTFDLVHRLWLDSGHG